MALIGIETKTDHGQGKPTSKIVDELADRWVFVVHELGVDVGPSFESLSH